MHYVIIYIIHYLHYNIIYVLYYIILYSVTSPVQLSTWGRLVYNMVFRLLLIYILKKIFLTDQIKTVLKKYPIFFKLTDFANIKTHTAKFQVKVPS